VLPGPFFVLAHGSSRHAPDASKPQSEFLAVGTMAVFTI
jgi:hypothetical protein